MNATDFIKLHPWCCFCGGATPSATIDHQPAIILFPEKDRPKGMEFPACERCNKQTSIDECMLGFVARMTGSRRKEMGEPDFGFMRALETLKSARPDMLLRMKAVTPDGRGALDLNQPELDEGFCRLAAKLALGIYYEERRKICSPSTFINTFWTHNQRQGNDLVSEVLSMFPASRHLKMGRKDTEDTFFIRYLVEGSRVLVGAVFYESVALLARFDDGTGYTGNSWQYTFTPQPEVGLMKVSVDGDGGNAWNEALTR